MTDTKRIRFISRAGDPRNGVIVQPGTVLDFPATWADRYITQGVAELVEKAAKPMSEPRAVATGSRKKKGK